jgi:hypothetical protein
MACPTDPAVCTVPQIQCSPSLIAFNSRITDHNGRPTTIKSREVVKHSSSQHSILNKHSGPRGVATEDLSRDTHQGRKSEAIYQTL